MTNSSTKTASWVAAVLVGAGLSTVLFFAFKPKSDQANDTNQTNKTQETESPTALDPKVGGSPRWGEADESQTAASEKVNQLEPLDASSLTQEKILDELKLAFEKSEPARLERLLQGQNIAPADLERLKKLIQDERFRLKMDTPLNEVGEVELNRVFRWALNFEGAENGRLLFDLEKSAKGWKLGKFYLPKLETARPNVPEVPAAYTGLLADDALGVADAFLKATLSQDFSLARSLSISGQVSDVSIAGVCILFEEGTYQMRAKQPIRNLYLRESKAGFVAKIESKDGKQVGDIGLTASKTQMEGATWRISGVALDSLLRDYANRTAGGDIYYTPLVKNPEGGMSIALYYGFDDAVLSERSKRQLKIIAGLIRQDSSKTISISGHTDAKGTEEYNMSLSEKRAAAVSEALIEFGVSREQIVTKALGKSQPRRPNFLEDGTDSEQGRKVNRRAEIYLDF